MFVFKKTKPLKSTHLESQGGEICPRDGMVVIPALEAGVERRVSSSLTEGTYKILVRSHN